MKGNPTAGIILLLLASLFVALGTKFQSNIKEAFNGLVGNNLVDFGGKKVTQKEVAEYWHDVAVGEQKQDENTDKVGESFVGKELGTYWDSKQGKWITR